MPINKFVPEVETSKEKSNSSMEKDEEEHNRQEVVDEIDAESFDELFPKLMEMRSKAAFLDRKSRQKLAEKVSYLKLSNTWASECIYAW